MKAVITGLNYLVAGLLGLVMAVLPTLLASWAILPFDGPPGEGLVIMLIYFVSSCACIPGYVAVAGASSVLWPFSFRLVW